MSYKLHQEPQVESNPQAQLELNIARARRTMKSPHELIEHVIKLYGAEFVKVNERIAALDASLKASGELLAEQKRANDELFKIKQRVVIANRELMHKNTDLQRTLDSFKKLILRVVRELPSKRDWLDPELETMLKSAIEEHKVRAEDTPA